MSSFGLGHYKCLLETVKKDWPMTTQTDGGAPGAVRLGVAPGIVQNVGHKIIQSGM